MSAANTDAIELRTHSSIRELGRDAWRRLTDPQTPPFLCYEWFEALETSGCVSPECGWQPLFLSLWRGQELLAAAPAYLKGHSMGEFVFDQSWARFAEQSLGVAYYPKLVIAVPFTPATGPRLLVAQATLARLTLDEDGVHAAFRQGVVQLTEHYELSGAHLLFLPEKTAEAWAGGGFEHRYGVQFHWRNAGYRCFEDFVERFASKKRTQIRRERKEITRQGLTLEAVTGSDISSELVDHVYTFYKNTVDRFYWGQRYLNRAFFEEVAQKMPEQLLFVLARTSPSAPPIAGAFNLLGQRALYGRYWGATEEHKFLHFNVCFYAGINECIERGLDLFEPGAGGEHKLARGFEATLTHSLHHLRPPQLRRAVSDFLVRERQAISQELVEARGACVLRPSSPNGG